MDEDSLKKGIQIELENLNRLVDEMEQLTNRFTGESGFIETRAAGSILHDFYCGVEKIFEKVAIYIDGELPTGEDWHTELLLQMARPIKGIDVPIISKELLGKLKEYLRFRHLFRHIYGFELKWERFKNLCFSLPIVFDELKTNPKRILSVLS